MSEIDLKNKTPAVATSGMSTAGFLNDDVSRVYVAPFNPFATSIVPIDTDVVYGEDESGNPVKLKQSASLVEVWSGTATSSLDLTTIPGGYPGDGIYILTLSGLTAMIHFIEGEICFSTPRGVSASVEINKNASEVLSISGSAVTQIRRFRA